MMRYTGGRYDGRNWSGLYDPEDPIDVITKDGVDYYAIEGITDANTNPFAGTSSPVYPGLMLFDADGHMVYAQEAELEDCEKSLSQEDTYVLKEGMWNGLVADVASRIDTLELNTKEEPHREGVDLPDTAEEKQSDMSL